MDKPFGELIPYSWAQHLEKEIKNLKTLEKKLKEEYKETKCEHCSSKLAPKVQPKWNDIFKCLSYCPPESVKVVIVGQDPDPSPGHADGLAFSVSEGCTKSGRCSLQNIFTQLKSEYYLEISEVGSEYKLKRSKLESEYNLESSNLEFDHKEKLFNLELNFRDRLISKKEEKLRVSKKKKDKKELEHLKQKQKNFESEEMEKLRELESKNQKKYEASKPKDGEKMQKPINLESKDNKLDYDLKSWAQQSVLLLNSILTVEAGGQPMSHSDRGWEKFTDAVVKVVSDKADHAVFIFWGKIAETKKQKPLVDRDKHLCIAGAHPSAKNRHGGFLGKNYFKRANDFLKENGIMPINWIGLERRNSVRKQEENENKSKARTSANVGKLTDGFSQMKLKKK